MYTCISQSSRIISGIILLILIGITRPLVMNSFNIKFSYAKKPVWDSGSFGTLFWDEVIIYDFRSRRSTNNSISEPSRLGDF